MIDVILLIVAVAAFVLAIVIPYTTAKTRINFVALGLLAWVLTVALPVWGVH
jgi:hypothetical protein